MDATTQALTDGVLRWIHVAAGILWIGHLYFFNFVNSAFAPTLDADSKKKVVPQLMPRALYWFRWGAAWTWVTGVLLLFVVFYHGGVFTIDGKQEFTALAWVAIAVTFLAFFVYDPLAKTAFKKPLPTFVVSAVLVVAVIFFFKHVVKLDYRAYNIHVGAMFGTMMAMNVWMRIWPAQKKIITAVRDGQPPDAALVAMAGARSRHNTYMSVPLLFTMVNYHHAPASGLEFLLPAAVLLGWGATWLLYKKAKGVPGF